MKQKTSILAEIFSRRIPQIVGMYIAAVWLAVEIAEWMSSKFSLPSQLSSYVFIGMLVFIPSVIMLAWGHGKPGRDKWSKLEISWLPLNIILSIFAINNLITKPQVEIKAPIAQTIAEIAENETLSQAKALEGEKHNYNRVISFFWQNETQDKSLEWLSYGTTWLFAQDLKRTPNISVTIPYNYDSIIRDLKAKGYKDSLNVPVSLAAQVASDRLFKWMILGSFNKTDDKYTFKAQLYKVKTGNLEHEFTATNNQMFKAIDKISDDVGEFLLASGDGDINIIPDLAIQDHISNNIEAIKLFISARNHVVYNNAYQAAIDALAQALELDPTFALANVYMSYYYNGLGDYPNAIKHTKQALLLDHKIYKESVFAIKSNLFRMQGEQDKALLILENWVNTFPQSPRAHSQLAYKYLYTNNHLADAEKEFNTLLKLDNDNPDTLIQLGKIYRARENKAKALDFLGQYLQKFPDSVQAYMQMGNAFNQFSMFNKALKMYQQASILGSKDLAAEIGIADTLAKSGQYQQALTQLDDLQELSATDQQLYDILKTKLTILQQTGQIAKAFIAIELLEKPAKKVLAPLEYLFNIDSDKISLFTEVGDFKQALAYADNLRDNLKPPFSNMASLFYLLTYFEMHDEEKFEKEFKEFEAFLANFPMPIYDTLTPAWRGVLASWQGEAQKAVDLLDQSISGLKNSIMYLQTFDITDELVYNKAIALSSLNKDQQALEELNNILNRNPIFGRAHYLSAKIYQKLGEDNQAQLSIQKAQQIWQDADDNFVDLIELNKL